MMKRVTSILLALMLCLSGAALADGITMTGTASVQLAPDIALISVGVTATAEDVLTAQSLVNEGIGEVVAALTGEMGIQPSDVCTSQYWINENYRYDYEKGESIRQGYTATCTLDVCVRNIDQAGAVIDAAMRAGANQLSNVQFSSSDQRDARDEALKLAVQDAMRKAQVVAEAAGLSLPQLPSAIVEHEVSYYNTYSNSISFAAAGKGGEMDVGTELQTGMLTLTAMVDVTYNLN